MSHTTALPLPDAEFAFSWADFDAIAKLVRSETGIALAENKASLVYSRLSKRVRKLGLADFRQYCALLRSDEGADERRQMVAAITTNVTRFFREPHHFEHLAGTTAPRLAAKARSGKPVRLWSAGCSSGEEPYSIAITLLGAMPDAAQHDLKILASDIDPAILVRAKAAEYTTEQIAPVPADLRAAHFIATQTAAGQRWRVADEARRLIAFRELNLHGPWPMQHRYDVIFCRNVMIYFDDADQVRLTERFAGLLTPGGFLYVGHSERVDRARTGLVQVGHTVYQAPGA